MTDASRGDVWLIDFGKPVGHEQGWQRPAVVVSSERMHRGAADLFIVVPTTTTHWGMPSHVEIEPGGSGLDEVSYAKVEDVKSVSGQRLIRRFGAVGPDVLDAIARIIGLLMEP